MEPETGYLLTRTLSGDTSCTNLQHVEQRQDLSHLCKRSDLVTMSWGFDNALMCANSRRIVGQAQLQLSTKAPTRQARPLTVMEVQDAACHRRWCQSLVGGPMHGFKFVVGYVWKMPCL